MLSFLLIPVQLWSWIRLFRFATFVFLYMQPRLLWQPFSNLVCFFVSRLRPCHLWCKYWSDIITYSETMKFIWDTNSFSVCNRNSAICNCIYLKTCIDCHPCLCIWSILPLTRSCDYEEINRNLNLHLCYSVYGYLSGTQHTWCY